MLQPAMQFQLVFMGIAPGTTDKQVAGMITKLMDAFHMTPDQALAFIKLRRAVIQGNLAQPAAMAGAARFQAMGLSVLAVPQQRHATGSLGPAVGTGYLAPRPTVVPAPAPRPPSNEEFMPAHEYDLPPHPDHAPTPAAPATPPPLQVEVLICSECRTKNRNRGQASIRCVMCHAPLRSAG